MILSFLLANKSEAISRKKNAPSIRKAESSADCKPFIKANLATGPFTAKKKSPKLMKLYPRSPFDLNKVGLLIDMLLILVGYPLEPTSHRSFSNLASSPIVNLEFFLNKSSGRLGRPLI